MNLEQTNKWLWSSWDDLTVVILSCIAIYLVVILMTRYSGLRTFAKMSSFDFAITIAIGSIIASTIMNGGQSILKGTVVLLTVTSLQMLFSIIKRRSKFFKKLTTNTPILLMDGSTILYENLEKVRVSESELIAKLREANVIKLEQVLAVVMETTGDISVLHSSDNNKLDDLLLKYVDND